MNFREQMAFLGAVNKELSKFRAFKVGVAAMVAAVAGLAAAYASYSVSTIAATIVALGISIAQFLSASIAARREVLARPEWS